MKIINKYRLLLFASLLFILAVPAALSSSIVQSIEIKNIGPGEVDRSHVLAHTTTVIGKTFDRRTISRDIKALLDTGRFSTVDIDVKPADDGVVIIYSIRNKYRLVNKPVVVGVDHFWRWQIRRWVDLNPGDLVDDRILGAKTRKVIEKYRDDHYPNAVCTWKFKTVNQVAGTAHLTLIIDEGEKSYVKKIILEGNDSISSVKLREALNKPAWYNVFRWFWRRKYEGYEIDGIEAAVRRVYLNHGFLDVEVNVDLSYHDKKGRRVAKVSVSEGYLYQLSDIAVSGVSIFPEPDVNEQVLLKKDDTASISAINEVAQNVQKYYGDRGYLGTFVRVSMIPDSDTRKVSLKYIVEEGSLTKIRNVIIRGNTRTKDKVIRREILVYPSETYHQTRVRRSERILRNLGFFETVRAFPQSTSSNDEKDLIFEVQEKPTGQFMLGTGFSSVDKIMGFVELQQSNFDLSGWPFIGGGQKLRLRAQISSTRRDYSISLTEPWFLDRRLSLGFSVYRRDRDYTDYDLIRTGGTISLSKGLPWANRINLRYRLEKTRISDVADTNTYYEADTFNYDTQTGIPYLYENDVDRLSSSLRLTFIHDTRNSPFIPTKGNRLSVFYELMGGPLGADLDIYNVGLNTSHYVSPWFGHVLSLRTRAEFVEAFGDTEEIPLAERLFLGGGRTLRGFDYREVGPKVIRPNDDSSGYYDRTQGGQSLLEAKVEYTVPIVKGIRLAGFYDIGNVWRDEYHIDTSDLAESAGVGIRFDMPGFPIRIDRAWILEEDDQYTDDEKWVIWIGYDN